MKYSTKLSDAVHTIAMIAISSDGPISSNHVAESINTNPSCVRQIMSALRKAGLIENVVGHPKASLAREASAITLLDIYRAVEGTKPLLHQDTHTNPECGIGVNIQYALREYYDQVQEAAENAMNAITLEDIIQKFYARIGSSALEKTLETKETV